MGNDAKESQNKADFQLVDIGRKKRVQKVSDVKMDLAMVHDALMGSTYADLAQKYGISNASVSYRLNKAEVREVIEDALNHLATFAPIVVKNYRDLLASKSEAMRFKATQALADILGLRPAANQSQINVLYLNQADAAGISDAMRSILQQINTGKDITPRDSDVIDAEFTEILANE